MWAEWGKYAIIKMIGIYSDVGGFLEGKYSKESYGKQSRKNNNIIRMVDTGIWK